MIADFLYKMYWDSAPDDAPSDVQVTYDCLTRIAKGGADGKPVEINVHDCGAAYRFLMAVLAVSPGLWWLTGDKRLLQRPILGLVDALCSIGADIQQVENGWLVQGNELHAEEITVDCGESSQFASALLLIGERIGLQQLNVLPINLPSESYIDLTRIVVRDFQKLTMSRMADWSAALYWYAKLLLEGGGSYLLEGLDLQSFQPDVAIVRWFEIWGVHSEQKPDGVLITCVNQFVSPKQILTLDVANNIDAVPVLACMACLLPATFCFNNVSNLKFKESDRLALIQNSLIPFAEISTHSFNGIEDNQLIIKSKSISFSEDMLVFDACNDHRFVMGFTLFALKAKVCIKDIACVRKSYPHFEAEAIDAGVNIIG